MILKKSNFKFIINDNTCLLYDVRGNAIKKLNYLEGKKLYGIFKSYFENKFDEDSKLEIENYFKNNINVYINDKSLYNGNGLKQSKILTRLEILLTNECNLNCEYCYAEGGSYGLKLQTYDSKKLVDDLKKLIPIKFKEIHSVMFFGGEPLMNIEGIVETCKHFKSLYNKGIISKKPLYTLVTNGTLINEDVAEVLSKYDIQVTVSIDGDQVIHDKLRKYRNGKGSFQKVQNGIELLIEKGVNLALFEVTYTSLHKKMGYDKNYIRKFLEDKFGKIETLIVNCTGTTEFSYTTDETDEKENEEFKYIKLMILRMLKSSGIRDYACDAGLLSLIMTPNGEFYPCHKFIKNYDFLIGNINDTKIFDDDIYEKTTKKLTLARKDELEMCSECWGRYLCTKCPLQILLDDSEKDFFSIKEDCKKMKENLEFNILDLYKKRIIR